MRLSFRVNAGCCRYGVVPHIRDKLKKGVRECQTRDN